MLHFFGKNALKNMEKLPAGIADKGDPNVHTKSICRRSCQAVTKNAEAMIGQSCSKLQGLYKKQHGIAAGKSTLVAIEDTMFVYCSFLCGDIHIVSLCFSFIFVTPCAEISSQQQYKHQTILNPRRLGT